MATYAQSRNPTRTDDYAAGVNPGDLWTNTATGAQYVCIANGRGNAVFQRVAGSTTVEAPLVSGNVATDAAVATTFTVNLTGNATLLAPSNPSPGRALVWVIRQGSGGPYTLTLATGAGGFRAGVNIPLPLSLSTGVGDVDYLAAKYDAIDGYWDVVAFMKGY